MIATKLLGDRLSDRLPRRWRPKPAGPLYPGMPHPDETVTEALASMAPEVPADELDAAWPPEDNAPVIRQSMRPAGPQRRTPTAPQHAAPSGTDPYAAPVTTTGPHRAVRYAPGAEQRLSPEMRASAARIRADREANPPDPDVMQRAKEALRKPGDPAARGSEPVFEAMAASRRPRFIPRRQPAPRPSAWVQPRLDALGYPPCDVSGHANGYAEFMRHVSRITGTRSRFEQADAWPRPTPGALEQPPVRRGLAITAGGAS